MPAGGASFSFQWVGSVADRLRTSFFFLPAVAIVAALFGARLLVGVDVGDWIGRSTVDSARNVLSTTAAATITFASITFSVSLLIMQQGSNQFSPRVIHGLVRDPFNRRVIALVVGTFTYCLVTLQRVRGPLAEGGEEVVPEFAVSLGLLLGVLSVLAVVAAINHTSRTMDVSVILGGIVERATAGPATPPPDHDLRAVDAGPAWTGDEQGASVVRFDGDGWVQQVDRQGMLALVPPGSTIRLDTQPGRYAIRRSPICSISPPLAEPELDRVADGIRRLVRIGATRTTTDDPGYGVRQLVDVALRALSPGVNDPTTAQDAIFHLGSVLAHLLTAEPVPGAYEDGRGRVLLEPHALGDDELTELALAELRRAAANQPAVAVYLLQMIGLVVDAVKAAGREERARPLTVEARLILDGARAADGLDVDRDRVRHSFDTVFGSAL
jgi:uncharacterized membrane protein